MSILLPLAILLGLFFVCGFLWMAKSGQYDDLETPKYKILLDDKIFDMNVKKTSEDNYEEKKL